MIEKMLSCLVNEVMVHDTFSGKEKLDHGNGRRLKSPVADLLLHRGLAYDRAKFALATGPIKWYWICDELLMYQMDHSPGYFILNLDREVRHRFIDKEEADSFMNRLEPNERLQYIYIKVSLK